MLPDWDPSVLFFWGGGWGCSRYLRDFLICSSSGYSSSTCADDLQRYSRKGSGDNQQYVVKQWESPIPLGNSPFTLSRVSLSTQSHTLLECSGEVVLIMSSLPSFSLSPSPLCLCLCLFLVFQFVGQTHRAAKAPHEFTDLILDNTSYRGKITSLNWKSRGPQMPH